MKSFVLLFMICAGSLLYARDRSARLYNLDTAAVSQMKYSGHAHGKLSVTLPSGEVLTGEFSTIVNASQSWGAIYSSGGGSASGVAVNVAAAHRGTAIATGTKGTILECEYVSGAGAGSGFCKDNHGGRYKLMF